ncbi:hypothetical protein SBA1_1190019 [Candidatus Sulfotelmatobacter kueseliae]|uniref:Uncharacterized protein n=1 Tax=Candidatus Sulfotelmatobacter kueseliae TaxID=2042962 RepID=A0A2U3K1P9_9BACT|nr:hypothetical protein SBA1_1190019 [Candidatus Sulfotelmatobacter kueseliae]
MRFGSLLHCSTEKILLGEISRFKKSKHGQSERIGLLGRDSVNTYRITASQVNQPIL